MIKVSIIVPVYNVKPYLAKCLDSLLGQTLTDIEILVVNDGSTDSSQDIIDEYLKKDKRITAFTKKNGGLSEARNYALPHVKGEYVAFVDSDDYVDATMYEEMYEKAVTGKYDLVECDYFWEYPEKQVEDKSYLVDNPFVDIRVMAWNKLYKTSIIKKQKLLFPVGLRYEDISFCYQYLPYMKRLGYVEKPFYHYIQRPSSITSVQNAKVRDIYDILESVYQFYEERNLLVKYKSEIEFLYIKILFGRSFYRITCLKDKHLRKEILKEGYDLLEKRFPNWKKNHYVKTKKGLRMFYYRHMNHFTYHFSAVLWHIGGNLLIKTPFTWR